MQEQIVRFLSDQIGGGFKLSQVSSGAIHYVFRVSHGGTTYYLKVRSDHYALTPTFKCDPTDIAYEKKALNIFHTVAPKSFPKLIAYDPVHSMLLMSSIMSPEENLLLLLEKETISNDKIAVLAKKLASIHHKLSQVDDSIRGDREYDLYAANLYYKYEALGYKDLNEVSNRLKRQKKQIILGDLSPKNIAVDSADAYFCDFDNAHCGNLIYEVGFIAGHLLLHTLTKADIDLASTFLEEYYKQTTATINAEDEDLLCRVVLGTCIYRLKNKIFTYPLQESIDKQFLSSQILNMLGRKPLTISDIARCKYKRPAA